MKLLTLHTPEGFRPAMMVGEDLVDIVAGAAALGEAAFPASLKAILALGQDGLTRLAALAARVEELRAHGLLTPFAAATLAPVIPDADLYLSGAMNSRGHMREMGDTQTPPYPIAFQKMRAALAASGQDIELPQDYPDKIDWEGEFCVVIGKTCHRVAAADVPDHVAGFTLMNDVSARDFVPGYSQSTTRPEMTTGWDRLIAGKNFPTFCPIGPVIATRDAFDGDYRMETRVNGTVMQSSGPDDLIFPWPQFISYFSQFYRFQPGDIVSMGCPPGVGMARKPPIFLKPGDTVEVFEPNIGALTNGIAAPRDAAQGDDR